MRAIRLLSVLYNTLISTSRKEHLSTILEIFLRSIKPYFTIIHTWLSEGRLEDWREEFIFFKREVPVGTVEETEDFWSAVYKHRDYKQMLKNEGIEPLRLLEGLDSKILSSGKSIEILHKLDRIRSSHTENKTADLFTCFIDSLGTQLPGSKQEEALGRKEGEITLDPELTEIVASSNCPYLALALQEVFQSAFHSQEDNGQDSQTDRLLAFATLDPLIPLEPVLRRGLAPNIQVSLLLINLLPLICKTGMLFFILHNPCGSLLERARLGGGAQQGSTCFPA